MKIGYWLGYSLVNSGGVEPYVWRLLSLILEKSKNIDEMEIVILCTLSNKQKCLDFLSHYNSSAKIFVLPNFNFIQKVINKLSNFGADFLEENGRSGQWIRKINFWFPLFKSLNLDLLHIPLQIPPTFYLPFPFLITMHDVQELHYPEFFSPSQRAYRAKYYWQSLKYSHRIIVSFKHVKEDLVKYFKIPEQKIHICSLTYEKISLSVPSTEEAKNYQKKYKDCQPFLLYPAQTWPHKNHISLIKALEFIKENDELTPSLICTGIKNPDFFSEIQTYKENSFVSDQIHFLGIVPESELYWLYKNCSLVVIPTLYEAGSFPLLEAMSLGVPVICSSVTSLPQTIDALEFTFEPLDIQQISGLILRMLKDAEFREASIVNSTRRFEDLKKIDTFQYFFEAWSDVLQNQ